MDNESSITGACHCGSVKWEVKKQIDRITACNCTVCRKYGVLWAYGNKDLDVFVAGETKEYLRGDEDIGFHFCPNCGCVAYWLGKNLKENGTYKIAVNTRLSDQPELIANVPIRHFDGFGAFAEGYKDDQTVKDMWY